MAKRCQTVSKHNTKEFKTSQWPFVLEHWERGGVESFPINPHPRRQKINPPPQPGPFLTSIHVLIKPCPPCCHSGPLTMAIQQESPEGECTDEETEVGPGWERNPARHRQSGNRAANFAGSHSSHEASWQLPQSARIPKSALPSLSVQQGPHLLCRRSWHRTQGREGEPAPEGSQSGLNKGAGPGSQSGSEGSAFSWNPASL